MLRKRVIGAWFGSFLLGFLLSRTLHAASPPLIELTDDVLRLSLVPGIMWAEHTSDDLTIEELQSLAWQSSLSAKNHGGGETVIWYRFRLKNASSEQRSYVLYSNGSFIFEKVRLVIRYPDGSSIERQSGLNLPPEQRSLRTRMMALPFDMNRWDEAEFYLGVHSYLVRNNQFEIRAHDDWRIFEVSLYLGMALLLGFVAFSMLFIFICFLALRDTIYLAFTMNSAAMLLSILNSRGFISYLLPWSLPSGTTTLQVAFVNLLNVCMVWFTLEFLRVKQWSRVAAMILKAAIWTGLGLAALAICGIHPVGVVKTSGLFIAAVLCFEIVIGIFSCFYVKRTIAGVYLLGTVPYIASALILTLQAQTYLPTNNLTSYTVYAGQASQITVFSFALLFQLREMSNAKVRMEEKERYGQRVSHMLRILAHDLANYMMVIIGSARRLKTLLPEDPKVQELLERLLKTARHQSEILQSVRELKAVEDGKLQLRLSPSPIPPLLEELREIFQESCQAKEVHLLVSYRTAKESLVAMAEGRALLHSVLANLVSNALKFSPKGATIEIIAERLDDTLCIHVRDEGKGIPDELLSHLFETDQSTTREGEAGEKGTGFGLTIAAAYMKLFLGRLLVSSRPLTRHPHDHGTTFTVELKADTTIERQADRSAA